MSQAGATGKATGAAAIFTISGNDGVHESPIGGNFSFLTANSTVKFIGSPGTETLDFGLTNLFLGSLPASITSGSGNNGFGINAGKSITSAINCSFFGLNAGRSLTTGTTGSFFGEGAGFSLTTADNCSAFGGAAYGLGNGSNCTAIGTSCFENSLGDNLTGLGYLAGRNYTSTESSNVTIANPGVALESNTIRIGTQGSGAGQQNQAFLAGVTGVTVAASSPVLVDANGQLSDGGFGTATQVWTSNGAGVSPSWQPAGGGGFTPVNWSVQLSANQNNVTGNNTQYQIPYDSVLVDSASGYNAGTFLYTIPTTGVYTIIINNFLFGGTAASTLFFSWLSVNGAAFPGIRIVDTNSAALGLAANSEFILSSSYVGSFTVGDTIGVFVDVIGGVANDVGAGGGAVIGCLFNGFRIG